MDEKRQKEAMGFAGLSSLVSEVEIKPPCVSAQEETNKQLEFVFLPPSSLTNASASRKPCSSMPEEKKQKQKIEETISKVKDFCLSPTGIVIFIYFVLEIINWLFPSFFSGVL
jgi:hypothetical protein